MDANGNYLKRSTFLGLNVLVAAGYVGLAIRSGGRVAIEVYNAFLFGAAAGVVVAYLLPARRSIQKPYLSGGHMLRIGIFMSWSAVLVARSVSIVWRFYEQPLGWLDSVAWGFHVPGSLMAAYAHIISPAALDGRVPTRAMTTWGFRVMLVATIAALTFVLGDNLGLWWRRMWAGADRRSRSEGLTSKILRPRINSAAHGGASVSCGKSMSGRRSKAAGGSGGVGSASTSAPPATC